MLGVSREMLVLIPLLVLTLIFFVGSWWAWRARGDAGEALARIACRRLFCLTVAALCTHVVWAALLSGVQYRVWQQDPLSRLLLTSPLDVALPVSDFFRHLFALNGPRGYFLFYIWGRFWWPVVVSLMAFGLYALVLWTWKRWGAPSVSRVEIWLLLLMAGVLGWPLMGLAWMSIVIGAFGSLVGRAVFRQVKPPSLLLPTIVSGLWVLWFGMRVIVALGANGLIP